MSCIASFSYYKCNCKVSITSMTLTSSTQPLVYPTFFCNNVHYIHHLILFLLTAPVVFRVTSVVLTDVVDPSLSSFLFYFYKNLLYTDDFMSYIVFYFTQSKYFIYPTDKSLLFIRHLTQLEFTPRGCTCYFS